MRVGAFRISEAFRLALSRADACGRPYYTRAPGESNSFQKQAGVQHACARTTSIPETQSLPPQRWTGCAPRSPHATTLSASSELAWTTRTYMTYIFATATFLPPGPMPVERTRRKEGGFSVQMNRVEVGGPLQRRGGVSMFEGRLHVRARLRATPSAQLPSVRARRKRYLQSLIKTNAIAQVPG